MRVRLLRRLTAPSRRSAPGSPGCAGVGEDDVARYLGDPSFRRAELEALLVDPGDGYAALRLARYGGAWEVLPAWAPRVEAVTTADFGGDAADATRPLAAGARGLSIDAAASAGDADALRELGQAAFASYPVQLLPDAALALESAQGAARYGLVVDPATSRVGALVRAEMADGSSRFAVTCATCHAGVRQGSPVTGAPNDLLDLGKLAVDVGGVPPDLVALTLAWGPGRLDVSSLDASEPARIPDLRPTRWLTFLQQDATVEQRSVVSLAIRIETLIITSHDEVTRPPREVALGLALARWALADALPALAPTGDEASRGAAVVAQACAGCHQPETLTGFPVPLAVVGTDPTLGLSPQRGTGRYRVPSLRGVGSRGPLLHDASLPDLAAFFDPARLTAGYQGGRSPGPVPGHVFDVDLSASDRAAVLAYLNGL